MNTPTRKRLSKTRRGITHKAFINDVSFFMTVNEFDNGRPGEIFLTFDQSGSTIDGFADAWASAVSHGWQYGVPLELTVRHFSYQQFEPKGVTQDKEIRIAKSVVDYVARWLNNRYLKQPLKEPEIAEINEGGFQNGQ